MTTQNGSQNHYQVVIVGGGSAGISVAARLRRAGVDVAVVEPSDELDQRALGVLQPKAPHGAGAVEHDDGGVLRTGLTGLRGGRSLQIEQDGDGVVPVDRDELEVEMGANLHDDSPRWCWLHRR